MDEPVAQKPFEEGIEKLIARLRRAELPPDVLNLYRDDVPELDLRGGAAKRRENLRRYLKAIRAPRFAFIGIAPGWRGARFTGVAFTDEARLCFPGSCYDRTSRAEQARREATAGAVMGVLGARTDVVCWNLVPWHPHQPGEPLSNADPDAETLGYGLEVLEFFSQRLYPNAQPIAVGRLAETTLREKFGDVPALRHPAHGGAPEFTAGACALLGETPEEGED
jgi:uracil-DNA glycosylase